jgi:hypothetical protein
MGEWWAGVGFHPLYDCGFSCQKTGLRNLNQTHLSWKVDMQVPLADGARRQLREDWPLPKQSGGHFWLNHTDLGLEHVEDWFLMGRGDDWVALYYCGSTGTWKYSGGILFQRHPSRGDKNEWAEISSAFSRAGLRMEDACIFDNEHCEDPVVVV